MKGSSSTSFLSQEKFKTMAQKHGYNTEDEEEVTNAYNLLVENVTQEIINAIRSAILNADNRGAKLLETQDMNYIHKMHKTFQPGGTQLGTQMGAQSGLHPGPQPSTQSGAHPGLHPGTQLGAQLE